ncbi:hypothetical protein BgiMline_007450 [Biomphalaria glabrata]|nr:hypothetical protein BgiMline_023011 [Biomphalaria glabrata]
MAFNRFSNEQLTTKKRREPFIFHDLRKFRSLSSHLINLPWMNHLKSRSAVSGIMDDSNDATSPKPSPQMPHRQEAKSFVENIHGRISTLLLSELTKSMLSRHNSLDMNDFAPMRTLRNILLVTCFLSFLVAPLTYMPLGIIQAAYNEQCFLYTRINFTFKEETSNSTSAVCKTITFEAVSTEWGPQFYCDCTTYVPVSIAIVSVIIGWSTLTVWPLMLSVGNGSLLMLSYLSVAVVCLAVSTASALVQLDGYRETCTQLSLDANAEGRNLTCSELANFTFTELVQARTLVAKDVNFAMELAQIGVWCLVALSSCKVLISTYSLYLTWFHAHFVSFFMAFEENSVYTSDESSSQ